MYFISDVLLGVLPYQTRYFLVTELYKMVCEPDETDLDIHIPAVMLPHDAGLTLERMVLNSSSGSFFCYNYLL